MSRGTRWVVVWLTFCSALVGWGVWDYLAPFRDDPPPPPAPTMAETGTVRLEIGYAIDHVRRLQQGADVVTLRTPAGVLDVAVSAPLGDLTAERALSEWDPVVTGAERRLVAWRLRPDDRVAFMSGRPATWTMSLRADGKLIRIADEDSAATSAAQSPGYAVIVPQGAELAVVMHWEGRALVAPVDPSPDGAGVDDFTVPAGAGVAVRRQTCRVVRPRRLTASADMRARTGETPYWPGLGWAAPGLTWHALDLWGDTGVGVLTVKGRDSPTWGPGRVEPRLIATNPFRRIPASIGAFELPPGTPVDIRFELPTGEEARVRCRPRAG